MQNFQAVSIDLDDTLIHTSQYYQQSAERFGEFLNEHYPISKDTAIETLNTIDKQRVQQYGVQLERYPESFEIAFETLVDDPSPEHIETAYEIGRSTFKSEEEYAEQGFITGAQNMLNHFRTHASELHLVTLGDERAQQPKIDALGLYEWFDDVHMVTFDEGKNPAFRRIMNTHNIPPEEFIHVGDSATSDVKAALAVGGSAVYISDEPGWLSCDDKHSTYKDHDCVFHYETQCEVASNVSTILKTGPNPRKVA